jgi:hemoglobin
VSFRDLPVNKPALRALFERAGGEDGVSRILHDFYGRMAKDLLIGFFFDGKDIHAIAEMQKGFLLRAMGGTPSYAGKPPAQAHAELAPILAGHFDRRLMLLSETLKDHGLRPEDVETWVGFENAFRDAVVSTPKI